MSIKYIINLLMVFVYIVTVVQTTVILIEMMSPFFKFMSKTISYKAHLLVSYLADTNNFVDLNREYEKNICEQQL